mmetsp:Transcript_2429/g.3770  ORF Transcript_2429/g.3770 Transcript_2429/m.3770 type:complete len:372 (+) Transcript_2429:104-1219(+)
MVRLVVLSTLAAAVAADLSGSTCECQSTCALFADPHVISFDGTGGKITNGDKWFSAYKKNGLDINLLTTSVDETIQAVNVTYQGTTTPLDVSGCVGYRKQLLSQVYADDKGLNVSVSVHCHESPRLLENRAPNYFNVFIRTLSHGAGMNAAQIERAEGATGQCVDLTLAPSVTQNVSLPGEFGLPDNYCVCEGMCTNLENQITTFEGVELPKSTDDQVAMHMNLWAGYMFYSTVENGVTQNITLYYDTHKFDYLVSACENGNTTLEDREIHDSLFVLPGDKIRVKVMCGGDSKQGWKLDGYVYRTSQTHQNVNNWAELAHSKNFTGDCVQTAPEIEMNKGLLMASRASPSFDFEAAIARLESITRTRTIIQ